MNQETSNVKSGAAVACSALLCVWKEQYPIIKALGNGWHLVAHQNGPAIARADNWQYLGHLAKHWTDDQDDVPPAIRYAAVEALMDWAVKQPTWPTHNDQAKAGGASDAPIANPDAPAALPSARG